MPLGDEIAVLEGLPDAYSQMNVLDASAGANYSGGSSFAPGLPLLPSSAGLAGDLPNAYDQMNVLDASAGGNYSGGSSFAPGLPLLPSNAGLADSDLAERYGIAAGTLRPVAQVIDASGGANYSGGSSFAPGLPLLPSSAGLADHYDGKPLEDIDWYWGSTMGVDDGNAYGVTGVLDASAGANYSGGSSFAPGLPLLPSSVGLAGLDAVSDDAFKKLLRGRPQMQQAFQRVASKQPLMKTKLKVARLQQKMAQGGMPREVYERVKQALITCRAELDKQRAVRANVAALAPANIAARSIALPSNVAARALGPASAAASALGRRSLRVSRGLFR